MVGAAGRAKGAAAVALAVYPARIGEPKETLRREIVDRLDYDLSRTLHEIRVSYRFDVSCQGSVPEALIAFLDAHDLENAIRFSVSLAGEADTQASIAGAVTEAFWGDVPDAMTTQVLTRLPAELREITCTFRENIRCGARVAPNIALQFSGASWTAPLRGALVRCAGGCSGNQL